jgi:hypothetical protein
LQQQGLPPLQPSQQKKGEGVANFLSGLSKKKDKLKVGGAGCECCGRTWDMGKLKECLVRAA